MRRSELRQRLRAACDLLKQDQHPDERAFLVKEIAELRARLAAPVSIRPRSGDHAARTLRAALEPAPRRSQPSCGVRSRRTPRARPAVRRPRFRRRTPSSSRAGPGGEPPGGESDDEHALIGAGA